MMRVGTPRATGIPTRIPRLSRFDDPPGEVEVRVVDVGLDGAGELAGARGVVAGEMLNGDVVVRVEAERFN
jgi:hypothetical protein